MAWNLKYGIGHFRYYFRLIIFSICYLVCTKNINFQNPKYLVDSNQTQKLD